MSLISSINAMLQEPFKQPLNFWRFGLLVLIAIVFIILWTRVLAHIEAEV